MSDQTNDTPLILKSVRLKRAPLFDSLLSLGSRFTGRDDTYELQPCEQTYELEVGGRKRSHSNNSLLLLSRKQGVGSAVLATLNFTNSILGAGLMGLPYAMMRSGLILGLVLLAVVTVVVDWSILLLIRTGRLACASSYQDLMGRAYGFPGSVICGLFQVVFSLGGMCAYVIILADNVTRVAGFYLPESILAERAFVILVTTIFGMLPLSLSRNLNFLGNFSLLALVSVVFIIFAIVLEAPVALTPGPINLVGWGFLDSLGIISFAFVCHHNSFEIHDSLEIPSVSSFAVVTHMSTGISLLASMILSVPVYLCFGEETEANVLNNFGMTSTAINVARVLLAVSLGLTYPLDCFVAREVLSTTLFGAKPPEWSHYLITSTLVSVTTAVCLGYTNLEMILEITGGFAASALAFIFPAACYLKLSPDDQYSRTTRTLSKGLFVFGVFVLLASTVSTILRL